MATTIRVVVLKDGEIFVAQCLEIDVLAQGRTEDEAMLRLHAIIKEEFSEANASGKSIEDIGAAPHVFHAIYEEQSMTRKEMKLVA